MIGIAASVTADRLKDRDNTAGIGDNSAEISDDAAGLRDRRYHRERDPMVNSILNGDWSNSVPGRQILDGTQS